MEMLDRTQDSTEGERRDGHRQRQYWTTGCQLTTVTTPCFMFVFSVFLTIAIVSMNMACTDNPCDPHCQQIYRQYPNVTCSEQSAVPKQDHRTTENVELTRKKRSFCRGYCHGVAGARKYDNPCNQTATLKKTEDLYLCYNKTSFSSTVWIPLNSFHIGGYRGDEWNEYDWYLSSTDWDQGWDTVFTYTGNDWTPYSEYWLANSAKNWSKTMNMTKTSTHLILNFHTEKLPLAETPLAMSVRTWDHFTNSPCYHLTLFVYRKHANDPHTYLSICSHSDSLWLLLHTMHKSPDQQTDSNCHYTRPCQPKRNYDVIGTR
ncbi:uncharacterized protein LOC109199982 isoform X2 [Oreochromis niloticus]|uniref:uncharacterized protein LOC109199982 isoform X1 n=1 Tax=Oreochromis niloticus TaxID=8128 RepID=UPI000905C7E6|nr:uncharacterized protein LOC109199982 isoform X1 [Oreochromis niloticus]XP_019210901.1 uncharacterized protein LOC109199982 isoform X2 [Oreochromis niloticus]